MTLTQGPLAVVVDASAAMRVLAGDPTWVDRWREWTRTDAMLLTPAHFPIEVANALLRGTTLTSLEAADRLGHLYATGFETTDRALPGLLGGLELAERHRLTIYDALYLDLALDIDATLATLDRDLAAAAEAEGIEVIG